MTGPVVELRCGPCASQGRGTVLLKLTARPGTAVDVEVPACPRHRRDRSAALQALGPSWSQPGQVYHVVAAADLAELFDESQRTGRPVALCLPPVRERIAFHEGTTN